MPELRFEIDEVTSNVLKKLKQIYLWSHQDCYPGTKWAVYQDIWTGWVGFLTTAVVYHPEWKWPYWVREQTRPESPGYVPPGHTWGPGCTYNKNYRSFTMIGSINSTHEPVVGLDGTIMPRREGYSVTLWLYQDGRLLAVGEEGELKQELVDGYLPIVETTWTLPEVGVRLLSFVSKLNGKDVCFTRADLKNLGDTRKDVTVFIVVTPWGPDQFHPVRSVGYDREYNAFWVEGKAGLVFEERPSSFSCKNYDDGYICVDASDGKLDGTPARSCELGWSTGAGAFRTSLDPGAGHAVQFKIVVDEVEPSSSLMEPVRDAPFDDHLRKVKDGWKRLLGQGIQLEVPDKLVMDTYKSAIANLHLLKDEDGFTPGPTVYHGTWIRDASHMIRALDMFGYHGTARDALNYLLRSQNEEGYFWHSTTQVIEGMEIAEYDSNGQAIWTLVEHYKIVRDKAWLKEVYPAVKKGAEYLVSLRQRTMSTDGGERSLHYGLLPRSWSAEHTGPASHTYWDSFWGVCGLREAAFAARELGFMEDSELMDREADDSERCVWDSIDRVVRLRKLECFPVEPYAEITSAIIGNIACLWPCRIVDPMDERLGRVLHTLYTRFMPNGCWFHRTMWGCYGPILTWPVANCFVHRREADKVERIFEWTLRNGQTATHAWPEGIHPRTFHGGEGDGYEGWGAGELLMLLRNMLYLERGDCLWITPCVPRGWFTDGARIEVRNGTTSYGKLDFLVRSDQSSDRVTLSLSLEGKRPRGGLVFYLNHPDAKMIRAVRVDGAGWNKFGRDGVSLPPEAHQVEVLF